MKNLLSILALIIMLSSSVSAGTLFLKIDGLTGESTDPNHVGWIEIETYGHNKDVEFTGHETRSAAGYATDGEFVVVKQADKTTPKLNLYVSRGDHIKEVVVDVVDDAGKTKVKYTLKNVNVKSVSTVGTAGGLLPTEKIILGYENIKWTYDDGKVFEESCGKKSVWERLKDFFGKVFGREGVKVDLPAGHEKNDSIVPPTLEAPKVDSDSGKKEVKPIGPKYKPIPSPRCGDHKCIPPEACDDCPEDCGECPIEEPPEFCGDGICDENFEDCENCADDCGACPMQGDCGNGVCEEWESCHDCSLDCPTCDPVCGDGHCNGNDDCDNCPMDCGECKVVQPTPITVIDPVPVCGNQICETGENCNNCDDDCGYCV